MLHRGRSIMEAPGIERSMLLLKDVLRENRFEVLHLFYTNTVFIVLMQATYW